MDKRKGIGQGMRDRLIEMIGEYYAHPERFCPRMDTDQPCSGCKYDLGLECDQYGKLADHLLANGVIVPPCKVGDTVYRVAKHRGVWEVLPREVVSITHRLDHLYRLVWEIFSTQEDRLGKTVFLTREEAEKALAER
jgi:hypothetical protein